MPTQTSSDYEVAEQTMAWLFTDATLLTLADASQSWVWDVPAKRVDGVKCRLGFRRAPFSENSNHDGGRIAGLLITVEVPYHEGHSPWSQAETCHQRLRELLLGSATKFDAVSVINANMDYSVLTSPFWLGRQKTPVPIPFDNAHGTSRSEINYLYHVTPKTV